MSTIVVHISPETYKRLEEQARNTGKAPEALTREMIEAALRDLETPSHKTVRDVLESLDRTRPLSEAMRRRIIPGVTLDEVRTALTEAAGPSLSETVLEQRGPRL